MKPSKLRFSFPSVRTLIVAGLVATISACEAETNVAPTGPNPRGAFDGVPDPLGVAINTIESSCPAMASYLRDLDGAGRLGFAAYIPNGWDGMTEWNTTSPDGLTYFRTADTESITIGSWLNDYSRMEELVYMLRHEYGHAYGWAEDGPDGTNGYETSCNG